MDFSILDTYDIGTILLDTLLLDVLCLSTLNLILLIIGPDVPGGINAELYNTYSIKRVI